MVENNSAKEIEARSFEVMGRVIWPYQASRFIGDKLLRRIHWQDDEACQNEGTGECEEDEHFAIATADFHEPGHEQGTRTGTEVAPHIAPASSGCGGASADIAHEGPHGGIGEIGAE
jgi:hypothetical protein